jgi:hypothetical protein
MALILSAAAALAVVCALIAWQTSERDIEPTVEKPTIREESRHAEETAVISASSKTGAAPSGSPPDAPLVPSPGASSASPDERASYAEIQALVRAGRIGAARARANAYYERFPTGPASADIERLTGAHPVRDRQP